MLRKDDLQYKGKILYQDTEYPCFSEDSVLLANFLRLKPKDIVVDIGSGTGVLSILGEAKTGAQFTGIEKYGSLCRLAEKSAEENGQSIQFREMDISEVRECFEPGCFSAAVMNPPYFKDTEDCADTYRTDARHRKKEELASFFDAAFFLLKNGGDLYVCYPAEYLAELFSFLSASRLEPKQLQLVANNRQAAPRLALVKAKKNAKPGLVLEPVRTPEELVYN